MGDTRPYRDNGHPTVALDISGRSLCHLSCLDVYLVAAVKGREELMALLGFRSGKVPWSLGRLLSLCDGSMWPRLFTR